MVITFRRFAKPIIVLALLVTSNAGGQARAELCDTPMASEIDKIFAKYSNSDTPGCSVCVIQEGKIIYARGYGMADLSHGVALNSQSVFYIASVSKQFVALSTLLAARQGKLSLDDDIRKYLPEMPAYEKPITIRHLIHHTSGLRDYFGLIGLSGLSTANYFSEDYLLDLVARQKGLNHPIGEKYSYTNSGYFLLSQIIPRATGQTLREFSTTHIFEPLGMHHTFFFDDYTEIVKSRALGHDVSKDGKITRHVSSFDIVGSGGLFTTVEDLFLYDQNFYHNRLENNSGDLIEQFHLAGTLDNGEKLSRNYGFGHYSGDYRGEHFYRHGGSSFGFKADYIQFPQKKFSVAIFCNRSDARPDLLANRVADLFLFGEEKTPDVKQARVTKQPSKSPSPYKPSVDAFRAVVGTYYNEEVRSSIQLFLQESKGLQGRVEFNKPFGMKFLDADSLLSEGGWEFELIHDDAGHVTAIEVSTGRANGLIFVRKL